MEDSTQISAITKLLLAAGKQFAQPDKQALKTQFASFIEHVANDVSASNHHSNAVNESIANVLVQSENVEALRQFLTQQTDVDIKVESDDASGGVVLKGALGSIEALLKDADIIHYKRLPKSDDSHLDEIEQPVRSSYRSERPLYDDMFSVDVDSFLLQQNNYFDDFFGYSSFFSTLPTTQNSLYFVTPERHFSEISYDAPSLVEEINPTLLDPSATIENAFDGLRGALDRLDEVVTIISEPVKDFSEPVKEPVLPPVESNKSSSSGPAPNSPPLALDITEKAVNIGVAYVLDASEYFSDSGPLTYSATLEDGSPLPAWLSIDVATGMLSGTAAGGDAGGIAITVSANDGEFTTASTFALTVQNFTHLSDDGDDVVMGSSVSGYHSYHTGDGDDTITAAGNPTYNTLYGGSGNDQLNGAGRGDELYGGSGNDTLYGGEGNDTLSGGEGNDVFLYTHADQSAGTGDLITDFTQGEDSIELWLAANGIGTEVDQLTVTYDVGNDQTLITHNSLDFTIRLVGNIAVTDEDFTFKTSGNTLLSDLSGDDVISGSSASGKYYYNGADGNDTITAAGNPTYNTLYGGSGNDQLNGAVREDALYGGSGNDTLFGSNGIDTLTGGEGNDVFLYTHVAQSGGTGDLITDFTQGEDKLDVGVAANGIGTEVDQLTITYDVGNDQTVVAHNGLNFTIRLVGNIPLTDADFIFKNSDGTLLSSLSGDETVTGENTPDLLNGGDGNDSLYGSAGGDTLFGGGGDDTLDGGQHWDVLYGGQGNDFLYSDASGNYDDTLYGGAGSDIFYMRDPLVHPDLIADFEQGIDKIMLTHAVTGIGAGQTEISVTYDAGNDRTVVLHNTLNLQSYVAGNVAVTDADFLFMNTDESLISSLTGDDTITAANNMRHYLYAGDGDDSVTGANKADVIYGGDGNDTLNGAADSDTIYGGNGNDLLMASSNGNKFYGEAGNDTIIADSGSDFIYGGAGEDAITTGAGEDYIVFEDATESVLGAEDVITDFDAASDVIYLSGMGVTGIGVGANDVTISNDGVDTFIDHNSNNFRIIINGVHTIDASNFQHGIIAFASPQGSLLNGTAYNDIFYGDGYGADTIYAGDGNDYIDAGEGGDYIDAGAGDDTVYGGYGGDTFVGGAGNDIYYGNHGGEYIYGGEGNDTLTGSRHTDKFIFEHYGNANADNITDFMYNATTEKVSFEDDVFVFASGDGAKDGVALTDNVDIFDVVADFAGGNFIAGGGATFLYDGTDGQIWYDADGEAGGGAAELVATIDNFATYNFSAGDFEGW